MILTGTQTCLAKQLGRIKQNVLRYNLRTAVGNWVNEDDADKECSSSMDSDFLKIFNAVKKYAHEGLIDRIIDTLIYDAVFEGHDDNRAVNLMRGHIVFAMLGWLSMLYVPSFNDFNEGTWRIHHDPN